VALAHWRLGFILFAQGEHTQARFHLGQMSAFYERQYHELLVSLCGSDAGISAVAYDACCLWCLGYPDQALMQGRKALALSQEMGHPFTRAEIVSFAGCMPAAMRRDGKALQQSAGKVLQLVAEKGLPTFLGFSTWQRGEALVLLGQPEEGMAEIRQGIATSDSTEVRVYWPRALAALGEAQAQAGQVEDGLATLSEALALVAKSGEHLWETEIYRLQAELLLLLVEESAAENSLRQAIGVARRQEARSWELRAQSSLARLWQEQGKEQEARQRLAEVYGWFTEGFDTPDLVEARALLRELSG
jgi:adenylate cyclase